LFRRKRKYQRRKKIEWEVDPETAKEIIAIVLIIAGFLFLFSLFGIAGSFVGNYLVYFIKFLFGFLAYPLALASVFLGITIFMPQKISLKPGSIIGLILFALFLPAFIHLFIDKDVALESAKLGQGGGIVGFAISFLFRALFGPWIPFLIICGLCLISLMLIFSLRLAPALERLKGRLFKQKEVPVEIRSGVPVLTMTQKRQIEGEKESQPVSGGYHLPSYDLLEAPSGGATSGDVNKNLAIIAKTLANFGITVTMFDVSIGPTVTQYTLKPAEGVKLSQITARTNDLALALAAHPIRIEAPIPGKALVGIEVPNQKRAIVSLKELFLSREWREHDCKLPVALGRDVAGVPVVVNLEKMPHLLVAGSTGSGKTIFLNALIINLLFAKTPSELKFILIDPKRVEFTYYNNLPHLLAPVVADPDKIISTLKWTVAEMERRYKIFQEVRKRDIDVYNQGQEEKMPYIVVIIDELADLMALAASEVEAQIVRIAQMARATGIHLVLATQRPSVDVITGLIKANVSARIAFAVASQVDSRTILDTGGAERLLGDGDMLYQGSDIAKPRRIQGALVREKEIKRVTEFIRSQVPEISYNQEVIEYKPETSRLTEMPSDKLYEQAKEVVLNARTASASLLQRRLGIGYTRAARLLDFLEQEGVIGPAEGSKPREVLIEKKEEE